MLTRTVSDVIRQFITTIAVSLILLHPVSAQTVDNPGAMVGNPAIKTDKATTTDTSSPADINRTIETAKVVDSYRLLSAALSTLLLAGIIFMYRASKQTRTAQKISQQLEVDNTTLRQGLNECKNTVRQLNRIEKYARLLLDSADNGIYGVDAEGKTTFVNNYLIKRTGWTEEDLIGKDIHQFIHHSQEDGTPHDVSDRLKHRVPDERETHHVLDDIFWCKDGNHFQVEYTVTPIIDGEKPEGAVVVFKDISERIRSESGLRESEERLQAIINNTTAVITLKNTDGRYILVNKRFEELFKMSGDRILGLTDYDIFPDKQAAIIHANDQKALKSNSQLEFIEEVPQEDGMHTYLSVKFTLTRNDGRPYAICNVATDITERKRTEDALRRAQKMEAIGQLTGGIAHDFNNLLGIIVGNLDLLHDELGDSPARQHANSALKAALRGSDLTRRLLAFSRKATPETKPLCVNQIITDMQNLIEKSLTASISVQVALHEDLWLTDINQGEFEDAIINLAVNARDAMPNGGTLYIATRNTVIDESYSKNHTGAEPGEYVLISVRDTGSGINEDIIEKVLDPFFTTKPGSKGSGLGLSMVYGFVKRVRGYINLISKIGMGTTVEIFLPRSEHNEAYISQGPSTDMIQQGGDETILIVDDEPDLALIAEGILSKYGYRVLKAGTAAEAIAIIEKRHDIDLLFSDVVMPGGMDGYALAQYTKLNHPNIKIILASGFTQITNRQQYGASEHAMLRKPYRKTELIDQVRKILDSDKEQS